MQYYYFRNEKNKFLYERRKIDLKYFVYDCQNLSKFDESKVFGMFKKNSKLFSKSKCLKE